MKTINALLGLIALAASAVNGALLEGAGLVVNNTNTEVKIAPLGDFQLFEALSTEAPPADVFAYTNRHSTFLPPRYLAPGLVGNAAIPTNNWWGNMIAYSTDAQPNPVWANPYVFRATIAAAPYGLTLSYPYTTRAFGGSTGNGNANQYYLHAVINDLTLGAAEFTTAPTYEVYGWDDLSVSVRLYRAGDVTSKIESTMTSGMALVTGKYAKLTPKFSTVHAILTVNGAAVSSGQTFTDSRFVVTLNSGQRWVIYSAIPITLRVDGSNLVGTAQITAYVRAALVGSDAHLAVLDKTRLCLIEGGDVEARDTNTYAFNMKTSGDCSSGLFHYLQVHHLDTLDRTYAAEASGADLFSTTRGKMTGVLTKTSPPTIRFTDTTSVPADFYPPRKPSASVVASNNIKQILINDINAAWSIPVDGSYYFNGKAAQKYANLCLLANDDSVTGSDKASILRQCLNKLEAIVLPFVENKWTYPMQYDTVYRGIVSSQGFVANDPNVDFGNTMYNDHHYHWGYWITTAAIINYLDPSWSRVAQMNRLTSFLIRDAANPSNNDKSFTKFRNFDWFRGHSYSHGVTPFGDGKDEESTSEEINFHYGVTLFGKATNNAELTNIGQLMLKLNARAVQTYFLMKNDNRVHPATIIPNKVTGIFFDNKADYATWFSGEKFAIHGIQMIPITPVTEYVRSKTFVQEEWDQVLSKIPAVVNFDATNAWLSLLYANYATVNSAVALQMLQLAAMDDGLTRSWALYMAATRP
ncbi:hypothetical protein Poli38472_000143 [Pythium oligandrum]|uniref:glucan endo-1,3-beta-D-glucosidase n=1 Tax=Pythium oligandrum TaxID=41045 RepID=A0A8K1CBW4_PYTOL|nr:hypothetical protein Poli38472_000143 [Pythium oligandrum]|eukprot:TMW60101.1 hypothetical protein Poli38472_000143 [Pythium oligandrum]